MKHKMMRLQRFGAAIFFLWAIVACEKDDIKGSDVQPRDKVLSGALVDDLAITTGFILETPQVLTGSAILNIVGAYKDETFGLSEFGGAFEVQPPEDVVALLPNLTVDSVVLGMIVYDSYGPDSEFEMQAYYLDDTLGSGSYYNDTVLVGTFAGAQTVSVSSDSSLSRFLLDPTRWASLLESDSINYDDYEAFSEFLGAIRIQGDGSGLGNDQGVVARFNVNDEASGVRLYLSSADTTQEVFFPINSFSQKINTSRFDRGGSTIETIAADSTAGSQLLVQGLGGVHGLITINNLRSTLSNALLVNNAELTLHVRESSTEYFDAPTWLKLKYIDQNGELQDVTGLTDEVLGGEYQSASGRYTFNFGTFIQEWLADEALSTKQTLQLVILVSNEQWHPHRVDLQDALSGDPGVEFEVIFTPQ